MRDKVGIPEEADARVVMVIGKRCVVETAGESRLEATARGRLFVPGRGELHEEGLVVGDLVSLTEESGHRIITGILPRRNEYVRSTQRRSRQVMFTNVDRTAILASVKQPETRPAVIDRFLMAALQAGLQPLLVLTKIDLDEQGARVRQLKELYGGFDLLVRPVSNLTGEGIEDLAVELKEGITAVVGNSGVGKSSLLNRLIPGLDLRVRGISGWSGKGVHTTTASVLVHYGDSAAVIDTPGMKSFIPWGIDSKNLADLFPDIAVLADGCYFRSCLHAGEPNCAVAEAAEEGRLPAARLCSYRRILEELQTAEKQW